MNALVTELEHLIRTNRLNEAHGKINSLGFAEVPRAQAAKMANLALRSGALFWAVRLLNPIVRTDSAGIPATNEEKAEYAFALIRVGAHSEAHRILAELETRPLPKVQLYLAAIHANSWNYEDAYKCFVKYLAFDELSPYERLIGKLNLASSLISTEKDLSAGGIYLGEVRDELESNENKLLYGNSLELSAQLAIKQNDFASAKKWIELGQSIFPGHDSPYALFFKKWEAVLKFRLSEPDAIAAMEEVRRQAVRMQHHETIREADSYLAVEKKDSDLFSKVYFGTPWPHYRERIMKMKPAEVELTSSYDYYGSADVDPSAPTLQLDRLSATVHDKKLKLKSGQLLHRTLVALTSDFYRPIWVAAMHTQLFSDEFFHPETGPKRVHQAMFRLRNWLKDAGLPLEISEFNGRYQLTWEGACRLHLTLENIDGALQGSAAICHKLIKHFAEDFGTQEAASALKISPTLARQALRWGVENNVLSKLGNGPRTRYKKAV